ncbi:class I SAM-dependent methyltransferase [Paenibacillus segetis]|nr:class I SAM-dependent methyltransferase [Paenibacillus segetis]
MANISFEIISGLLITATLFAVLSIVYTSWRNGISPMPTSAPVRREVTSAMKRIGKARNIVEAGSGWGTLALHLSGQDVNFRITGIENSLIPLWVSRLFARLNSADNVTFIRGDLYAYSYKQADVILCYLYPSAMKRLSSIFREQLVPGTKIISICFALPGWEPREVITCRDMYRTKVYIYEVVL